MRDNSNTFHIRAVLAIGLLAVIIYSNALNCGFVFDDQQNITQNPYMRVTDLSLEKFSAAAFKSPSSNRPVANVSFAVNYYLGKYNVVGYHIVNILIHLFNGILVYVLAGLMFKHAGAPQRKPSGTLDGSIPLMSLFAALLFIAHPIQVQSVTYIVQRMNSMAVMFYLASLICFIYGRISKIRWKRRTLWALCLVFWIFALGSKETAATLPLVLLLYEWYFFQDLSKNWIKHNFKYFMGLIAVLALTAYMFLGSNPLDVIAGAYTHRDFTLEERVLTQFRVLVFYLSLLFYPHPLRLNLLHHITTSHSLFDPITTLFSLLMLALLFGLAVSIAKKQRLVSFCILWFFIHLAIESSVIGLEIIFEHRLYLPMVGFALTTAYLLFQHLSAHRTWAVIAAAALIVSLGTATYFRNRTWQDPVTLWYDVVSKSPLSPRAHYNLGSDLARQGQLEAAVSHLSAALKLKPDYTQAHNNLGLALFKQGKPAQAASHFSEALRMHPGNTAAHYNLGLAWEKKGDLQAAANQYSEALRIKPDFAEAHNSLGAALQTQGKLEAAVYHFSEALNIKPAYAAAHHNMGYALEAQGDIKNAVDRYLTALSLGSDDAETYNNLGVALTRLGILKEAVQCYQAALRLKPGDAGAHNNLGVARQRQGKLNEAVDFYLQALRLQPDYAEAHNNLGIVLAEQGRFKEAVDHFSAALRIRPDDAQARHNLKLALRGLEPSAKDENIGKKP